MTAGNRLIIIGGAPRSGTSLVQTMLDSHPDIFGGPEFDHLTEIVALRTRLLQSIHRGRIDAICSPTEVDRAVGALIENLLLPAADRISRRLLSEKTPMNVLIFPELLEILPGARFIHVVRDPRAVVASMLEVAERHLHKLLSPPDYISTLENCIATILEYAGRGFAAQRQAPDRVYCLVYENLIDNPEAELKSLTVFLGIPWSEQMLHPGSIHHAQEKVLQADGGLWAGDRKTYSDPEKIPLHKWQNKLILVQQEKIFAAFFEHPEYRKLGYEFSYVPFYPPETEALLLQAGEYLSQDELDMARASLDGALAHMPDDPWLRMTRGNLLIRMGEINDAFEEFWSITQNHPYYGPGFSSMGLLLLHSGQASSARFYLEQAAHLEPHNPEIQALISQLPPREIDR